MPDTVRVVDEQTSYTLVYRLSGFQEKAEFFEVYSGSAKFDQCGLTRALLVDKEEYDRGEGKLKAVVLQGKRLKVLYTDQLSAAMDPEHARLTVVK